MIHGLGSILCEAMPQNMTEIMFRTGIKLNTNPQKFTFRVPIFGEGNDRSKGPSAVAF